MGRSDSEIIVSVEIVFKDGKKQKKPTDYSIEDFAVLICEQDDRLERPSTHCYTDGAAVYTSSFYPDAIEEYVDNLIPYIESLDRAIARRKPAIYDECNYSATRNGKAGSFPVSL